MSTTTATGARIEIRGLTKRFGSFVAVDDLSFDVEPGRITGFLGPNGAGKTTTLRMLLGLVHADERHRDDRRAALRRPRRRRSARWGPPSRRRTSTPAAAAATTCGCWRTPARCRSTPGRRAARADRHPRGRPQARRRVQHGHAPAARPRGRAPRRPAGARPRRAVERPGPRGHPLAARLPAPPQPARARRSSCRATSSRRSSRPSTRSSSSPTGASCGPAPMRRPARHARCGRPHVRPRAPRRRPARRRRHEHARAPTARSSPTPPTCASSATSPCAPGLPIYGLGAPAGRPRGPVLRAHRGHQPQRVAAGGAPAERDAVTGQEGANL